MEKNCDLIKQKTVVHDNSKFEQNYSNEAAKLVCRRQNMLANVQSHAITKNSENSKKFFIETKKRIKNMLK